jgi:hypothetical protein
LAGKTAEDRPVDRPRLFDRQSRVRPVEPAERPVADARPTAPPLTRLPAPPRAAVSRSEPDKPGSLPRPAADDAQFSPRAIMARERPIDAETAAPRRERPRIAARAVAVSAPAVAVDVPPIETDLVESALLLIVARSADLQGVIDPESKVPVDTILDHTRETTERVMEIIARAQSDELRRINGDLSEVLDLILLMQLEKGHAPADDALTLILQLRRELETLRAA